MMRMALFAVTISAGLVLAVPQAAAQKKAAKEQQRETVAKPLSDKEKRRRDERLRKELEGPYRKWMSEDVAYIITDEERQAWKRLATPDEMEQFIEQFWLRRDPTPDSAENEFKEEHYRRIAYANERFASGIPGWKSDRGRIYIAFGPPDEIEDHPSGGTYERPIEEGGGTTSTFPFAIWRYRWIEGIGTDILIEFVDPTMTGEYRMTMDPSEKDALLYVPNAGLTMYEQMGLSTKADRFSRTDGTRLGTGDQPLTRRMNQFERLQQFANLQKPPAIKFKDLEAVISSSIKYNMLPVTVRADFMKMTSSTVFTTVTAQFDKSDLQFQDKDGVSKAVVNILGRITSMSRRPVQVFEEVVTLETASSLLGEASKGAAIFQKGVPLTPGTYRLNLVLKDIVGGSTTNYEMALNVPRFEDETLAMSSLILADIIETVPTRSVGTGQFVYGDTKVRPRVTETFNRGEKLGIYIQLYNFTPDEKTQKPNATVTYEITKNGTNEVVFNHTEEVADVKGASAQQYTVRNILPLAKVENLTPGNYTLKMTVKDRNSTQVLTPTATFKVI